MNLSAFFKTISVVRFLSISLIFILDIIRKNRADSWFKDGLELGLAVEVFMFLIFATYIVNTFSGLIVSFKPQLLFYDWFKNKLFLRIFYVIELLVFPLACWEAIEDIRIFFFPKEPGIVTKILDTLFQEDDKVLAQINRMGAINLSLFLICSLLFIIFFWKYYNMMKRKYNSKTVKNFI